ncbi:MAG: hypothetical protein TH68_05190 [Candidatus Synechococcus spongiarum 142]|uniref:Uncharacterized protein n=1 Tax=Candidatus Synechococcus spongiarum 142 TaxID=1608213 RepID=A0A6N3X4P4_9SYNE|nr:MAG: hypothetical protein TH68_05190 [Candidatus Synechococcus spongiarum 142]
MPRKRESIHQPAVKKVQSPGADTITIGEALTTGMPGEAVEVIRYCTMDSRLRGNDEIGTGTADCSW